MTRAVGYFRVSTARQGTDEHFSLPVQEEMFLKRCQEKGYTAGTRYVDTESGKTVTRKGYQQMLADARAGEFDVIVVRSIDRFGRDADEITVRSAELRQVGVQIDAIKSVASDDMPTNTQFLLRSIEAFLAHQESDVIKGRISDGMKASAKSGNRLGQAPYGYRSVDKKLVIEDEEASVVRRIFEEFADKNMGSRRIAIGLNRDGIPTLTGGQWAFQTVNNLLKRETYAGVDRWAGIERESPAIISRDLWDRAQMRWRIRKSVPAGKTHTSQYLLSGILFCECGARMLGKKGSTANRQRYYQCRAFQDGTGAASNTHMGEDLEQRVIRDLVESVRADHDVTIRIDPPDSPLNALVLAQRDLALIPGQRKKMLADFTRGVISDEELADTREILREDEERLEARVADLHQRVADADARRRDLSERPGRVMQLLDPDLPDTEKKAILMDYAPRIIVRPGDPEPYIVA